ncbi:hypothetical protein LL033_24340 (plasmid) [Clostridium estertheticum]|uniref:hypothetical protein n=1 Tax=Clostridium estertheticum TaxID=238834 RepID=UPI001C0E45A6|nr:hypothetical protein [Clostridium estertheticum]MBU3217760.1 hypothetical protein [Clostridium estertheticum]WAG58264.1 hypothetical protein LL033_24340 [Clostridium estertheticum]
MNSMINQVQPRNYTNKYLENNKNKKIIFDLDYRGNSFKIDDKKISEEEDKILYELYQKSHMAHSAKSFEDFKKDGITFPPDTAPGIVRKVWREKWEKATAKEKDDMRSFDSVYETFSMENKKDMPNDLNGYLKLMNNMKSYIELYNHCPGVDQSIYEGLVNLSNSFETELNKYN